jgi:hypothetical protein
MSDLAEARALALALPDVIEQDHHGMASFRVRGKILATLPDEDHIRIMVGETEIHAAVAHYPSVCAEFYWGQRLACVVVALAPAPSELIRELLAESWLRKAPKALARDFPPAP